MFWLCAAFAVFIGMILLIQVPLTFVGASVLLLIWKIYIMCTKGFELGISINMSALLLFLYPTFDFSLNLSIFYIFSWLLVFLDLLSLGSAWIAALLKLINKLFV